MENKNEEGLAVPTPDGTLLDIRELSIQCRELLHQFSTDDSPAEGAEARELMASFNIWVANMGVFHEGRQSVASRLRSAPQISELTQQLLVVLKHDLVLRQKKAYEEKAKPDALPAVQSGQRQGTARPSVQPSATLSTTTVTKLDPKKLYPARNNTKLAESVSSVKIPFNKFPTPPKFDSGGTSFTCPYCFLVCPVKEASGPDQWMSHLIHDFEPFFCVFDECSLPFTCAGTYTGWLAHMRDTHTQPSWCCFYCNNAASVFSTPAEFEQHLEERHREMATGSLRPTLIKHSMVRDQHALQECPLCGGFPEEIVKAHPDRDSKQAREALEKHVGDHLLSVALILAPEHTGEPDGEQEDTGSEAVRGSDSERDLDGVGDTYDLECQDSSCDCKEREKNSAQPGFSSSPTTQASAGPDNDSKLKGTLSNSSASAPFSHPDRQQQVPRVLAPHAERNRLPWTIPSQSYHPKNHHTSGASVGSCHIAKNARTMPQGFKAPLGLLVSDLPQWSSCVTTTTVLLSLLGASYHFVGLLQYLLLLFT
ncbi:hypothetical protein LZ32DRAFT_620768 [Colletotrichum eremochloae]|nr:hypothetical protein LZ32DRAFT_620768 [Colletotrichum eremochloae]